jgi:UDP-N-acetylglucosamine:LPS N-acetylglucosamine transferase
LAEQLADQVLGLIQEPARRQQMEVALAELAQPEAAYKIAQELQDLAKG